MLKCDIKRESRPESGIPALRTAPDRASRAGIILIVFRSYRIDSPVADMTARYSLDFKLAFISTPTISRRSISVTINVATSTTAGERI